MLDKISFFDRIRKQLASDDTPKEEGSIELNALMKGAMLYNLEKTIANMCQAKGEEGFEAKGIQEFFAQCVTKDALESTSYLWRGKELVDGNVPDDSYLYILHEASQIAAGSYVGAENEDKGVLHSIFTAFGGEIDSTPSRYPVKSRRGESCFNYPTKLDLDNHDSDLKALTKALKGLFGSVDSINRISPNQLLLQIEEWLAYAPSSNGGNGLQDIPYYIDAKMTAAIAASMYLYEEDKGNRNYKDAFYSNQETFRSEQTFLLVSGDVSGIQDFIYTIPSDGALKSLRGRSFYLEILVEYVVDTILRKLHLGRSNVIYTGGGHFYLLLPNTDTVKSIIKRENEQLNDWLLKELSGGLYLALGMVECTAHMLMHADLSKNAFSMVSQAIGWEKLNRYSNTQLTDLFDHSSVYNKNQLGSRECPICHTSTKELVKRTQHDGEACKLCNSLENLGEMLAESGERTFVVAEAKDGGDYKYVPIYSEDLPKGLYCIRKEDLGKFYKSYTVDASYGYNGWEQDPRLTTQLDIADYVTRKQGRVVSFSELAEISGHTQGYGINRLGVLRADVDDLGAAFIAGFNAKDAKNDSEAYRYASMTRYATFSAALSTFFKVAVQHIAAGNLSGVYDESNPFSILGKRKSGPRDVHIIYSGGDDVFIVGAWDDLLELAVDIRRCLRRFSDNKIKMSAGLGLFTSSYPISQMAKQAGELESLAKRRSEKDSLALFGLELDKQAGKRRCKHVYTWEDFEDKVCGEKVKCLLDTFKFEGINADDETKVSLGKSAIYKMMNLLEAIEETDDKGRINIARALYLIARWEPTTKDEGHKKKYNAFLKQMNTWIRDKKSRGELLTAIYLIIYFMRKN